MKKYNLNSVLLCVLFFMKLCFADESSSDSLYRFYYSNPSQKVPFKLLNLEKGDDCGVDKMYTCMDTKECIYLKESIRSDNYLDICTYKGKEPIVCCPTTAPDWFIEKPSEFLQLTPSKKPNRPTSTVTKKPNLVGSVVKKSNIAAEKCRQYNSLNYIKVDHTLPAVVGGTETAPQEFPHMAVIGYGDTTEEVLNWQCGGSLISEKWILTAAHCVMNGLGVMSQWIRLGDHNINSDADLARPKDYRIVEHVTHPDYNRTTGRYSDIALLRLESDAEFSSFARPVCLNSDSSKMPTSLIVTGWGATGQAESASDTLLKLTLDLVPVDQCNSSYSSINDDKLYFGILSDSMICAGSFRDNEDTCMGDSGGPLQTVNTDNPDTYTQFGITSFGSRFCGDKSTPGVYTRVSHFIPWIEEIVWSDQ